MWFVRSVTAHDGSRDVATCKYTVGCSEKTFLGVGYIYIMARESCLYTLQVTCESFSEIVTDLEGHHRVLSSGAQHDKLATLLLVRYLS